MKITLIRHGYTEENLQKKYIGTTDVPLSENWIKSQDFDSDESVKNVYVSEKIRTHQTAELLFPNAKQIIIPEFNEMNFGDFENRNYIEMENDIDFQNWIAGKCENRCPNGESKLEFLNRVEKGFIKLINENERTNKKDLKFVVHGGTIMAICTKFIKPEKDYFEWKISCLKIRILNWNGEYLEEI